MAATAQVTAAAPRLVMQNISKTFGPVRALEGIDLVAQGGRTMALVGRSGSGKSTLLALVPRLYDPTEGLIEMQGTEYLATSHRA